MNETGAGRLQDKVALITGGTQGIGLGIASAYLDAGARVAVVGRDEARLAAALEQLDPHGEVVGLPGDVSHVAGLPALVDAVVERFGRLDVLVNVAGVFRPGGVLECTEADFDEQMDINVKGTLFATQAAVPAMLRTAGGGKVINISSTAGQRPFQGVVAYCTTKAAVDHLTRLMAAELAPSGINVNCIVPGNIEMPTNVLMQEPGAAEATAAATPARRNGFPRDVAAAAIYLASADADFVHGSAVVVDGGVLLVTG